MNNTISGQVNDLINPYLIPLKNRLYLNYDSFSQISYYSLRKSVNNAFIKSAEWAKLHNISSKKKN
ncbi:hypothetical protein BpHYR1_009771 [Brachionus plicatilis]|uniref:Uncharacterized protein n=1 Tax=Brachionus plicatilis TaxID=10195 RepID=A0A3M7TB48_BRAPC|nr:hypothetical protein BpHYR1_009771 [Brachionus plicatilis]